MYRKHGHASGNRRTREYRSWCSMITRCYNVASPNYYRYGARGIRVCERWRHDFGAFLADMGPRPVGLTLDRINTDGQYEPGNCRWASPTTQIRTRTKRGRVLTYEGVDAIRQAKGSGSSRVVGRAHGVSHVTVQMIWRGEIWQDA